MTGLTEMHILSFVKELELLETLHINTQAKINRSGLKAIVRDGKRLSCLKIDSPSLTLDVNTYQDMLVTLQKRDKNIKLDLTIYGNGHQLSVPDAISKGTNEKWFSVKELNRSHNHIFLLQAILDDMFDDDEDDDFDDDDDVDELAFWHIETDQDDDGGSDSDSSEDSHHDEESDSDDPLSRPPRGH